MKKVLHLASWYPNKTSVQGGDFIQRQLQAISLFQPTQVICVVKDLQNIPRGKKTETSQNGLLKETVIYYHPFQTGISIIDKFISRSAYLHIYKKEIKKYIWENGKPDLIHLHVAMHAGLAAVWAKQKYNIPFIITEHWCGYFKEDIKGLYQGEKKLMPFTKYILKHAKAILPVSEVLAKSIKEIYNHPNIHIIPNTVNEDFFCYEELHQKKFSLLHVSSMNYFKNAEGIFTAFDKFIQLHDDAELICLGDVSDSLKNWVTDNISAKGKSKIFFKGVTNYEEVAVFMKQSHALIINSFFETFSCVAVEALQCGLPVVSTPVGILPEVITNKNGMIVNDNDELYTAIKKMYETLNTGYARDIIAVEYKGKYSYQHIGRQLCSFYEEINFEKLKR